MSNLIERLRDCYANTNFQYEKKLSTERALLRESADALEKLQTQNEQLRKIAKRLWIGDGKVNDYCRFNEWLSRQLLAGDSDRG